MTHLPGSEKERGRISQSRNLPIVMALPGCFVRLWGKETQHGFPCLCIMYLMCVLGKCFCMIDCDYQNGNIIYLSIVFINQLEHHHISRCWTPHPPHTRKYIITRQAQMEGIKAKNFIFNIYIIFLIKMMLKMKFYEIPVLPSIWYLKITILPKFWL